MIVIEDRQWSLWFISCIGIRPHYNACIESNTFASATVRKQVNK